MSDKTSNSNYNVLRVVPFTGPTFAIWAFFGPESFGIWFGTIVRAFRNAAGL